MNKMQNRHYKQGRLGRLRGRRGRVGRVLSFKICITNLKNIFEKLFLLKNIFFLIKNFPYPPPIPKPSPNHSFFFFFSLIVFIFVKVRKEEEKRKKCKAAVIDREGLKPGGEAGEGREGFVLQNLYYKLQKYFSKNFSSLKYFFSTQNPPYPPPTIHFFFYLFFNLFYIC